MKILRFKDTYFVYLFKKVYFVPAPHKFFRRVKWMVVNALFIIRNDNDCDGSSLVYMDRLTRGDIYYWRGWNYSRVGGSWGTETVILNKWSIRK